MAWILVDAYGDVVKQSASDLITNALGFFAFKPRVEHYESPGLEDQPIVPAHHVWSDARDCFLKVLPFKIYVFRCLAVVAQQLLIVPVEIANVPASR